MDGPRTELGEFAPQIETIKIPVDKIREVIGSGGKVIREIAAETGAKVDIERGRHHHASPPPTRPRSTRPATGSSRSPRSPNSAPIYTGKVVKIVDFGAFVNFFGAKDGLVHVSQISKERVNKVSDVLQEGQTVKVKLLGFDDRARPGCR
jgi:polyribonucleotide nucleotidyltransferase